MKSFTSLARVPAALLAMAAVTACSDEYAGTAPRAGSAVPLSLDISSRTAATGERIAVALRVGVDPGVLGGVQGALHFDPARLRYVGQAPEGHAITLLNDRDAEKGRVRLASFRPGPTGISGRVAHFVFEVRGAGYAEALRYDHEVAATTGPNARRVRVAAAEQPSLRWALTVREEARRMTALDWAALLEPSRVGAPINARPGEYRENLRYGDVNFDSRIELLDYLALANAAVGNDLMIFGTDGSGDADRDLPIAGNVAPLEPGLPCGSELNGSRVIDLLDYLAVANEAVGTNEVCVGDVIPGRGPIVALPVRSISGAAALSIDSGEVVTFSADTIWQLEGVLRVRRSGELRVLPGALVQGLSTNLETPAIFVERGGRIIANGTPARPIRFSCTASPKTKGCWGGIFIAGAAPVNAGEDLGYTNPFGGNQRRGEGGGPDYGGSIADDSSGVIRYAIIEYAGKIVEANKELNGLTLGGVGRRTVIENVQIHAGIDDGIEFFGGTVNVKYLLLTGNDDDQFDFSFGWNGDAQFVVTQGDAGDAGRDSKALEGDNAESPTPFTSTPRTAPRLFNFTLVGNLAVTQDDGAIQLRRGNGAKINNFLIIGYPIGLDLVDAETCQTFDAGAPEIRSSTFIDVPTLGRTGDTDPSGPGCPVVGAGENLEVLFINTAGWDNRVRSGVASVLVDALNTDLPDFSMRVATGGAPAEGGVVLPPSGSIFTTAVNFRGAIPPTNSGIVPFYSGWSRPFQGPTTP